MSVISLDAQAIESLNQEIIALDNSLIQNYLPELESELNAINGNVKGDEINPIINTILSQFQGVKSSLSTEMPKLEAFLEQQIKSYTQTEEELETELQTVMNRMVTLADRVNGVKFGTTPNGNGGANGEDIPGTPGPDGTTTPDSTTEEKTGGDSIWGNIVAGAAAGAGTGALLGLAGGPFAPITSGTGALVGAIVGGAAPIVGDLGGKLLMGLGHAGSWLEKASGDW